MAAKLGYGGLGNTNGARDFTGKEEAEGDDTVHYRYHVARRLRHYKAYKSKAGPFFLFLFWLN